jgi:hypothetical protein
LSQRKVLLNIQNVKIVGKKLKQYKYHSSSDNPRHPSGTPNFECPRLKELEIMETSYTVPELSNNFTEGVMKPFIALLAVVLLAGCVTSAEKQTVPRNQETKAVQQAYALCKGKVDSTLAAMRLSESFLLGKNKSTNYLEKIDDESYATDEQVADIHDYHAELTICRDKAVDGLQEGNADYAVFVSEYFSEDDKITADVVEKKLTIGEANRKVNKLEYYFSLKR